MDNPGKMDDLYSYGEMEMVVNKNQQKPTKNPIETIVFVGCEN